MRGARFAVVPAALALLLGAGCGEEKEKETEAPPWVDSPRLEAWEPPLAEGPELLSSRITAV